TTTIQHQTQYAMEDRLRLPTDQIYIGRSGCPAAFKDAVSRLPGVLSISCSSGSALMYDRTTVLFESPTGSKISMRGTPVDYGFVELVGVQAVGGRVFGADHGEDDVLHESSGIDANPSVILNETGARALGYATPQAAVNQDRLWSRILPNGGSAKFSSVQSS